MSEPRLYHEFADWWPVMSSPGDYDPDPSDTTHACAFAYLFREGDGPVTSAFEEHTFGLFPRATWMRLIGEAGFTAKAIPYDGSTFDPPVSGDMFLGTKQR